jgi:DNA-binding PadR family transcriptional regulator
VSSDLRPISYTLFAGVGRNGASAPELVEMAERGAPLFWTGAKSQVFAEARRLARLGYLKATSEPAKTRPRTVYRLTARGLRAMRAWLAEPSRYPRVQHEAAIRLFAADLGDEAAVLASLQALRGEVARLEGLVEEMADRAAAIPHRHRNILLELSLARRLLQAHLDWVDEVERAFHAA